jgi:uncharacterized protein YjbJ (UPF0337 family)
MMNKDELKGKLDQVKGRAKQEAGELTNDPDLINEGVDDQAGGELREGFGTAKRKVGETIEDIGEKVKR